MKIRYILLYCTFLLLTQKVLAQSPIEFVENQGQWGDWFLYRAETKGGDILLEKDGFRFILQDKKNYVRLDSFHHGQTKESPLLKFHIYKVSFEGANDAVITGQKPQTVYYNYFLGNDSTKWKSGIHPYYGLDYSNVYKDIDMHVSSEKGSMVYEFMVKPGADVNQLKLKFEGQDGIRIKKGELLINTSVGEVRESKPYVYQYINDEKKEVACEYRLKDNHLTFEFPNDYDHSKMLIIDPTVVFSTLTGSTADNWGYTATYDNAGNFYAGGLVNVNSFSEHFPVSTGAFQTYWGGGTTTIAGGLVLAYAADISIIKYNPLGTSRIYATYIGGAQNEHPHSMIVDGAGNLVIAGRTLSTNYPVSSTAYQSTNHGGWDVVVTSLNPTGTALMGSTYLGGTGNDCVNYDSTEYYYGELKYNYGDDARSEVQVDNSRNIYVAGCTMSTNFPTTSTATSTTLSGSQDGVVFKLNPNCSSLIWSTYLGGNQADAAYVLAFDSLQQYIYAAGGTMSTNFPTTAGALHTTYQGGGADGFVTKFLNSGTYAIQKSTYVGTSGLDQVYGIQIYPTNDVYVMGQSIGGTFPVTSGVYSNPNSTQFIMKMDRNLTTNLVSTVFGSGAPSHSNISPVAFLVDTCSNVYVSGWGGNLGISGVPSGDCTGMPYTSGCVDSTTDGSDFYFIVFGANLATLRYATYYGRSCTFTGYGEHVDGGTSRFDKHGIIYQGICASCGGPFVAGSTPCTGPYPTTTGAWSEVDSSTNCNEGALKIAFDLGPVEIHIVAGPSTSGCAPLTVNFANHTLNGLSFRWDYGDGSVIDTTFSPTHIFTASGVYTVTLTAANSNACFVTNDTMQLVIVVDTGAIHPGFTYVVNDSCGPYNVTFTNASTGITAYTTFDWNFGDGTTYSGPNPPIHNYSDSGYYVVTLVMTDTSACNSPDSFKLTVRIHGFNVSGSFIIPDSLCLGTPFTPTVDFQNATTITWTYSDGFTSTGSTPTHTFAAVGTYTVTVIVANPAACNGSDTFTRIIRVIAGPTANFSFIPVTPEANVPTKFTNLSINANRYSWDFGDATSSLETNPVHQFSKTGTYRVCLTAYNNSNCPSVACREVPAEVVPIIGLPTGFSPNGDGENDILYVRGAAIKSLDLKIYNRWGELIFETTSKEIGWDGSYKGQPQPVDAYGYVLSVTFIDSTSKLLKGNITLLR